MTPLLSVRGVSNRYILRGGPGGTTVKPVLENVSLEIGRGEILGLVGESGCGKTTLGRAVLGLIDYDGEITIDGITRRGGRGGGARRTMARKIQAVFQDPSASLNPAKRVGWILEEPLRIHREGSAKERRRQVDEMLELVGMELSCKNRRPGELSTGQRQRVCIAGALMLRPAVLVADEPVSSLDVSVGAQILNLFRGLHDRLGLALLFISHNLDLVYYLCGRIAVMEKGRIVETGPAEKIYAAPEHPCTRKLLEAARYC